LEKFENCFCTEFKKGPRWIQSKKEKVLSPREDAVLEAIFK
jgi:hypothetical protein